MISRRKFLTLGALAAIPSALGAEFATERSRLRVRELPLNRASKTRFVHFTDFHYKGDRVYADHVVRTINELAPNFACFTGDLIEDKSFLGEALSFIRKINVPVYGSPGNHDYWSHAPFSEYEEAFEATGGAWLVDGNVVLPKHDVELIGMVSTRALQAPLATRRLLLLHYPEQADNVGLLGHRFDLILSGHSHGGQVRLPLYGALVLPWGVGRYDLGYFESKGGPLYVNPGIGTYQFPYRFNCPPELTVVTI